MARIPSTGRGYGSASRIFLDAAIGIDPLTTDGLPGDLVALDIEINNLGIVTGTGVMVTVSLAHSLTYLASSLPSTPTVAGQNVIWTLPDLAPTAPNVYSIQMGVSQSAKLLRSYPLTASISVDLVEASLANNIAQAEILMRNTIYIPAIVKPE